VFRHGPQVRFRFHAPLPLGNVFRLAAPPLLTASVRPAVLIALTPFFSTSAARISALCSAVASQMAGVTDPPAAAQLRPPVHGGQAGAGGVDGREEIGMLHT
jgi:hypothetical protein